MQTNTILNSAMSYLQSGDILKAEEIYRQTLATNPNDMEANFNLGNILHRKNNIVAAKECFERIATICPENPFWKLKILSLVHHIFPDNESINQWRKELEQTIANFKTYDIHQHIDQALEAEAHPSFYLNYQGHDNLDIRKSYASIFTNNEPIESSKIDTDKIKLAFLVTNQHEKIFLVIMGELLNSFTSDNIEITIVCSATSKKILQNNLNNDRIKFYPLNCDFDRTITGEYFLKLVKAIKRCNFDIMFFWEIGSDVSNYFLPFFRLAPIQCTSWGTVESTGIPYIDYFISSELQETETSQGNYSEKLVKFRNIPAGFKDYSKNIELMTRGDFGLSENENIYLCIQSLFKIHPDFDDYILQILQKDPEGRVVFIEDRARLLCSELKKRFEKTIPSIIERITFVPRQERKGYYSLFKIADIVLDTIYYGGGITTIDAFTMNKVVVTMPGNLLRNRTALACYKKMNITEPIAADKEGYVDIAVKLATEKNYRTEIETKIEANYHSLYDNLAVIKEFEEFCIDAAKSYNKTRT